MTGFERIVAVSPGGGEGASARYRLGPIAAAGRWPIEVLPAANLPTDAQIAALLDRADRSSILLLQRILPSRKQLDTLRRAYPRIVFDFDDALYAVPPNVGKRPWRELPKAAARLALRGSPTASARARALARVLREVDVAVAGNEILAAHARRYAGRVVEIPTTVTPVAAPERRDNRRVVVWLGLPDNLRYLELVLPALRELTATARARVRIVSSLRWTAPDVDTEFVPWSPEAARKALLSACVGIAPLTDSAWTRGKCALRSIQYSAHGLPVVASPVGITDRVVVDGTTGYLASRASDWYAPLYELLTSTERAQEMGAAGLKHVTAHYSDTVAVAAWGDLLDSLAAGGAP